MPRPSRSTAAETEYADIPTGTPCTQHDTRVGAPGVQRTLDTDTRRELPKEVGGLRARMRILSCCQRARLQDVALLPRSVAKAAVLLSFQLISSLVAADPRGVPDKTQTRAR